MSKKRLSGMVAILFVACLGVAETPAGVFDGENKAEQLYGQGVHAFFDGDYRSAIGMFEQVEKLGSEDPRPYFFLAIAYHRLDEADKAVPMFQKAARLEWESRSFRDFDVSGALRRIQGNERIMIEKFRNQARTDWQNAEKKRREVKYRKEETKQQDVMADLARSFVGTAPFGARSLDPFRAEKDASVEEEKIQFTTDTKKTSQAAEQETSAAPPAPAKKADDDPFAEPAKKGEKKADDDMDDDDPFAESVKKDDEKKDDAKADESKDTEDEEDPFQ